jgi:hypothetical protein
MQKMKSTNYTPGRVGEHRLLLALNFMIRGAILLAAILLGFTRTFACVCGIESIQTIRQRSIETSELIFIGQVVFTDTVKGYFKLKVIKVFKGEVQDEVEASQVDETGGNISSCGFWPSPHWGDEFIVYANWIKETNRIYIDDCSATRSTSNPNVHPAYPPNKLVDRKQRRQAKRDLKQEIEILDRLKGG